MKAAVYTLIVFVALALNSRAQTTSNLVADQNPRYKESLQKYTPIADSLTKTLGTTTQQTYKAYDFYEARLARRSQRREWRHQENMNRPLLYNNYWSDSFYSPYWRNSGSYYRNFPGRARPFRYYNW
ncbi:hypothetical protein [Desertivirga arenae]|uniref:hypothetical protein n=1 Tax=Desertivirga arenae TaxID=2810309 RepID=UPI001A97C3C2|nr:hypothetical protein [Pedobacter sp. SYSU D00823]